MLGAPVSEAWIQLLCPSCSEGWEANPSDLPEPGDPYQCPSCGVHRPVAEFARTQRDFEILEAFHET